VSDRFEATLEPYLAGIFEQKLHQVLRAAGFRETLRLAEPRIMEFQRNSDLLTFEQGQAESHRRWVAIDSDTVDLNPLVGRAARDTILEVSNALLGFLPWVDRPAVLQKIESSLTKLLLAPAG